MADCQAFYASCEKVANLQYRNKPLVVAGDPARRSGIVLAACPIAKQYGVTTAENLREALRKCPGLIAVPPRMAHYIGVSLTITQIFEAYSDLVEPFSIDEQHMDVTASLSLYGCSAVELAAHIQMRVLQQTGIYIRVGIGENKILAKSACDLFAKKNESGIHELRKDDLSAFWSKEVQMMFGVRSRMMAHLHRCGIATIGDLAAMPLAELKRRLRRALGRQSDIQAEVLWRIANGIDDSPVTPDAFEQQKGIGRQTTVPVPLQTLQELLVVVLELCSLICRRSRYKGYMGQVVHVGARSADPDRPAGFSRQRKLHEPTHMTREVYEGAKQLLQEHWTGYPVRKLWVSLGGLQSDAVQQLSLFGEREQQLALERTMDVIRDKYGDTSISYAVSGQQASQQELLSRKIGGHYK